MCVCKYVFVYGIHSECVSIVVLFSYHHFVYQDEKHFAVLSNKLFDLKKKKKKKCNYLMVHAHTL